MFTSSLLLARSLAPLTRCLARQDTVGYVEYQGNKFAVMHEGRDYSQCGRLAEISMLAQRVTDSSSDVLQGPTVTSRRLAP